MIEQILNKIKEKANEHGYDLTDNAPKIAKAKTLFFGLEHWDRCPCDPNSDRGCISERCHQEIAKDGQCHCHCYKLKELEQ